MDAMDTDKEKNKSEENKLDTKKQKILPDQEDQKDDKDTILAKRSGQRPALLFNRKKMTPPNEEET
jgi:hypothetical protein